MNTDSSANTDFNHLRVTLWLLKRLLIQFCIFMSIFRLDQRDIMGLAHVSLTLKLQLRLCRSDLSKSQAERQPVELLCHGT